MGDGDGEAVAGWTMGWRVGLPAGASWMGFLEGRDGRAAGAALESFMAAAGCSVYRPCGAPGPHVCAKLEVGVSG